MKKLLLMVFGVLTWTSIHAQGQNTVLQEFSTTAGTQHFFYKSVTKTVGSYVYVAGATQHSPGGDYDILVAKYSGNGTQQWIRQIDGAAHYQDFATALQVDGSGNVFITGAITNDTTTLLSDLIVVKFNSSGTEQWRNTYNGASLYDCGTDIFLHSSGTIYVTGSSYNASVNLDFVTIAYNSSGVQQWASRYAHSSGLNDVPVQVSRSGVTITTAGAVQTGTGAYSWAVVTYNTAGTQRSVTTSTGGTSGVEEVHAMATDAIGNIYLAGIAPTLTHGYDYDVIKLDSNLVIQWEHTYDGADHLNDIANGIQVNASGDVYVTGSSRTATNSDDYLTIKYNSSGSLKWARTFNDTLNGSDMASAIVLDNSGKPCITGSVQTSINHLDYYTMKYDTAGTVQWSIYYDGNKHLDDRATNIAIDTVGAVVVTGASETAAGVYEYATIKYVEKSIITPTDSNSEVPSRPYSFYQNKGQLLNTSHADISSTIKYYTNKTSPMHYIGDRTFSYVFAKVDTIPATTDTMQRIDVTFTGNYNAAAKVYPLEQRKDYLSYFLGHIPDGVTEIHANNRLVTPSLYTNIDLEYSSNQNGIKYYFIVKPGGTPTNIQLEFTGASSFNLNGTTNALTINSVIGSITFDRPTVYQLNSLNVIVPVSGWTADWQTNGASNKYKFNIGTYDNTKALIIEVDQGNTTTSATAIANLELATFYGGSQGDGFYDLKTDNAGNAYAVGVSESIDFPITHGVLQDTLKGNTDVVVVKFDGTTYDNTFSTYYGGSDGDKGAGIRITPTQEVWVAGSTNSTDFPVTPTAIQGAVYGQDGFVFKLNSLGTVKDFATPFGGGTSDWFDDIAINSAGDVYAVGRTYGSITLHAQAGTTSYTNGAGIILKLSASGVEKWATKFGNMYACEIKGVEIDHSDNVFLTGFSRLSNGMVVSNPYFTHASGSTGSDVDAFVTKLDAANDNILWSSTYGGDSIDVAERIAINSTGDITFVGGTRSSSSTFPKLNYPTGGNLYHGSSGLISGDSYGDSFIATFDNTGHYLFGTYRGAAGNESAYGVCYDSDDKLYVTGYTSSSSNSWLIPSPNASGAYAVTALTGPADVYLSCFNTSHQQIWGTYIGGHSTETGFGVACYQNLKLYNAGLTKSFGANGSGFAPFPIVDFNMASFADYIQYYLNVGNAYAGVYADGYFAMFDLAPIRIGIDEAKLDDSGIIVYPNPNNGVFNVSIDLKGSKNDISIKAYNIVGQLAFSESIKNQQGTVNRTIDLSYLSSGIYMLQVQIDQKMYTKKLIKN